MTDQNEPGSEQLATACLDSLNQQLAQSLDKIKHCLDQLDEAQTWWRPQESMNSIANVILHMCGNVTQWIISGVSGEPDVRDRPSEFSERGPIAKAELMRRLEDVVDRARAVLASIPASRLLENRRIQGFDETVLSAIVDSICHFAGHTQQIVYVTRLQLGDEYRFEWAPSTPEQGASRES